MRHMSKTDLLTAAEVAKRLGKQPRTIARWAATGRLVVAQRLPGQTGALLFDPADVDALLAEMAS